MLKLEPRPEPSRAMSIASPLIALAITVVIGTVLFLILGKDPLRGLAVFFVEPVKSVYALTELAVKATPLLLIALGLAVSFRSNVWNIGAEGQYIVGAIAASGIAMLAGKDSGNWFFLPVLAGGVLGGMLWAAIVALLRDRFNANEILVSLMLVYVAEQLLDYFVYGPWKDPHGYNFPQTITFLKSTQVPRLYGSYRVNIGAVGALLAAAAFWVLLFRTYAGFQLQVGGLAPAAARYAGFSSRKALWSALLLSGRNGGARWRARALRSAWPADTARSGWLRFRRDHRRLRRPAPSDRDRLFGDPDEHVLHRRRARAIAPRTAAVAHRCVPGPAAFHAARLRHADRLPHPLEAGASGPRASERGQLMDQFALLVAATLNSGTVLAFAALGLLINERAGIVNLGAEADDAGRPAVIAGFATAFHTGQLDWLASSAPARSPARCSRQASWRPRQSGFNTNQYATGLALSLFGAGFSAFVGIRYAQEKLGEQYNFRIPGLADLPFVGPAFRREVPDGLSRHRADDRGDRLGSSTARVPDWSCGRSARSPESAHALGYPGAPDPPRCGRRRRCPLRRRRGLHLGRLRAPLGRRHDRRQGLDRAGAHHLRDLAAGAGLARRLPVRRRGPCCKLQLQERGRARAVEPVPDDASRISRPSSSSSSSRATRAFIRVNMPASIGKPFFPG